MYKIFNKYILRTPLLSVDYFFKITKNENITEEEILAEFSNPAIAEAIYLASPILYKELKKLAKNEINSTREKEKIQNSFLKYLSRISSRSTPFGLFAGSSLGEINDNSDSIILDKQNSRHTRLDMDLTGLLFKKIESDPEIKKQLIYFPNTSLYNASGQLRYIESHYNSKGSLIHQIVEIENSEYLEIILNAARSGITIENLVNKIRGEDISTEEALEFIYEIIENQILISEIQQTVSGDENMDQLLHVLDKLENVEELKNKLTTIKNELVQIDLKIGNSSDPYIEIIKVLESLDIVLNEKHIFQTDLILNTKENVLNSEIKPKILKALQFLNKISLNGKNSSLGEFKTKFFERYESREMPLSLVLDEEVGIGYPVKSSNGDSNSLIDDVFLTNQTKPTVKIKNVSWSDLDSILLKKVIQSVQDKSKVIQLYDEEFSNFTSNWDDLSTTFSTISQIVFIDGKMQILMDACIASSAGNLLGRFCHGDSQINEFINEIITFEENSNRDKIIAEIVHLPENRIGNILLRPSFRKYEIPYLSKSLKSDTNQISVNDILISIRNNKIILTSKKNGQEILPRLTTAHNYSNSSLPMYRFLCDMQFNENRNYLRFDWGVLLNELLFLPRITYDDIILSTAKWKIETKELKEIMKLSNEKDIIKEIELLCKEKNLNQFMYLVDGDNKLLLNLKNSAALKMLFSEIKNKHWIIFEEFLFNQSAICSDEDGKRYVNEMIFSFYKDVK